MATIGASKPQIQQDSDLSTQVLKDFIGSLYSVTIVGTAQSVNTVESFTGYDFFGFLDDDVEETVEDEVEVGLWVH